MKKLLFLISLIVVSNAAFAQSHETNIRRLLEITGSANLGIQIVDALIPQFKTITNDKVPEEFWLKFREDIDEESLITKIIPLYQKYYTDEEIEELIAFYNTPIGKKSISIMPQLMQESMLIGQEWGKELAQKIYEELQTKGYIDS